MRGKSNVFKEEQYTDKQLKRKVNGIYNRYVKRGIDLCLAVPFFVILLPVYLIISAVIIAEDGFPVLYRALTGRKTCCKAICAPAFTNDPFFWRQIVVY